MNFLLGSDVDDREWIDLFDVVVVGAGKPAFLMDDRRDMLRIDTTTNMGTLHNFVGKPVSEVGGDEPWPASEYALPHIQKITNT